MRNWSRSFIYEWRNGQKIAENVFFVDYNWYSMEPNALYITEDHVLHGTGDYKDIHLENIKYADVYADQMLALTLDGNLWCRGLVHSVSDGRVLEYQGWELVLQNVAYAHLAHYRYMAITNDNALYMWGDNTLGQFGDGSLLKDGLQFKTDNKLFVSGELVGEEVRSYDYFGEMGRLEEPWQVNCTSKLHAVITE